MAVRIHKQHHRHEHSSEQYEEVVYDAERQAGLSRAVQAIVSAAEVSIEQIDEALDSLESVE